eukprot:3846626-Rhodomonas_salina.2
MCIRDSPSPPLPSSPLPTRKENQAHRPTRTQAAGEEPESSLRTRTGPAFTAGRPVSRSGSHEDVPVSVFNGMLFCQTSE